MNKLYNINSAMEVLEILSKNEHSVLWDLIEDFEVNGHIVSIKESNRFGHIVIDNVYVNIDDFGVYVINGKEYKPLDYAKMKLEK